MGIITTCTRDCTNTCGLLAHVDGGRVMRMAGNPDHPLMPGMSCVKAMRYAKRMARPDRVLIPLRKTATGFKRVSWKEALDELAERIQDVVARLGPLGILYYQGYGERTALKLLNERFFNHLGGVTTLRGSLCGGTGQAAQNMDFGCRVSHDPLDHANAASMVLWARNPAVTNPALLPIIKDIRKKGGLVVVIDPRANETAPMADVVIQPRPGGDAFLALGAAKLLKHSGNVAQEFLATRCEGADEFLGILDEYSLEWLAEQAGVSANEIRQLAKVYIECFPTATLLGWGLHRYVSAHQAVRAVDALGAMAGAIGVSGGGVSQGFEEYGPYDQEAWGRDMAMHQRKLLMPRIGREILNVQKLYGGPPIELIMVTAGNPVCMAPNSELVIKALESAKFVAATGHFLDDTLSRADLVLPATSFLEEEDAVASFGHNYVGPVNPVLDPPGECRSEFAMFQDLATRFDFADEYVKPLDTWLERILKPLLDQGHTLDDLRAGPLRADAPMVPYQDGRFATPSGRMRLMTSFDPGLHEFESSEYPYRLLTPSFKGHINSEWNPSEQGLLTVRLHPEEIAKLGLEAGQKVRVESALGRLQAVLMADPALRRDMAVCPKGGWMQAGHGINRIIPDLASSVGEGTAYYEAQVRITGC